MLASPLLRREIYPMLEKFFKRLGWKYTKMPHRFEYRDDKWVFKLAWSFTSPLVSNYGMMHKEIDDLKRELNLNAPGGHPNTYSVEGIDKTTLRDRRNAFTYAPNAPTLQYATPEYDELLKNNYCQPLNTLKDLHKWMDGIYEYISGAGMDYIEEYKYLPNLLKLLDNEMENKGRVWDSMMAGGFQRYTDVMLVAQLCSDINMEKKIEYVESVLLDPEYPDIEGGTEYWEEFLKILPTVQPRYPYYKKLSDDVIKRFNPPLFKDKIVAWR